MGLEHLYGRIVTVALGALLGVCALLATAKFVRSRARLLSPLVRAHGALFAVMMGAVAVTSIIVASVKPENAPTNMVGRAAPSAPQEPVNGAPLRRPGGWPPYRPVGSRVPRDRRITDENIADGYRVAETREGCEIVERDAFDAPQIHALWLARGGYKDKTRIVPYGWSFPWRDGILGGITVLSRGEIRPNIHTNYFPPPFEEPLAVVPSFNWRLLPGGVSNVFWHAVSPSNSLVVTWENSPVNRDVNSLTNFQAELFADGSFVYRYDDHTIAYSRVHPLDLDFDGLPNAIDPEPDTPLGAPVWNQSDAWAAVAFLNHAAEIMSAGGYLAWVMQRASDPNRRLVRLNVALQGGRWPVCVEVGIVPVMADGSSDLFYAIDCGAQVPFSLSDGELDECAIVELCNYGNEALGIGGEAQFHNATFTHLHNFTIPQSSNCAFPYECMIGDVTVHLDDPQAGWIRRTADVDVDDSELAHLHPGDSAHLTAVVTNCHVDAYVGCTWHGGEGISFSNPHSLATTLTYASSSTVQWATNNAYLVTSYAGGYSLTNTIWFTVGIEEEPTPCFTLGCQKVFFLNDADFLNDGPCPTNRPERIRPVTLNLLGPYGTNGTVKLSAQGSASPVMFYIDNGATNLITETTEIPLEVTDSFTRMGTNTVYMSCPCIGTGTISATLTLDGGETLSDTTNFNCIEPFRKLVNSKWDGAAKKFVNPCRLVYGTNAVLCVDYRGSFQETGIVWQVTKGSADVSPKMGKRVVVTPTVDNGVVEIEARFNDDEIQPKFVLPIVRERVVDVKAFVVRDENTEEEEGRPAVKEDDIHHQVHMANVIFRQAGIRFNLLGIETLPDSSQYWNIGLNEWTGWLWWRRRVTSSQVRTLMHDHNVSGCINMYFVGRISDVAEDKDNGLNGFCLPGCVFVKAQCPDHTLAHELGHAMGLWDCYDRYVPRLSENEYGPPMEVPDAELPISATRFQSHPRDWGDETGRGFYELTDTYRRILKEFIMYGNEDLFYDYGYDIPDDMVECLNNNNHQRVSFGFGGIGASNVSETNEGVYAR